MEESKYSTLKSEVPAGSVQQPSVKDSVTKKASAGLENGGLDEEYAMDYD
jgi:hypothetical protein